MKTATFGDIVVEYNFTPDFKGHQGIQFIKEIRHASGMGLAEAKGLHDIILGHEADGNNCVQKFIKLAEMAKEVWTFGDFSCGVMIRVYKKKGQKTTLRMDIEACIVRAVKEENWVVAQALLNMYNKVNYHNWK